MKKSRSLKKLTAILVAVMMLSSTLFFTPALASEETMTAEQIAAETLYSLGLFRGTGEDAEGNPTFNLEGGANRMQGMIMLVRLLGLYEEAQEGDYECPFEDAGTDYNRAILGFAFENGLTTGVTATRYNPTGELSAAMYLTFVLRALGYEDGEDFEWRTAWDKTDELGITDGEFNAENNALLRGALALVSLKALAQPYNDQEEDQTLIELLIEAGVVPEEAAEIVEDALDAIAALPPVDEEEEEEEEEEEVEEEEEEEEEAEE